MRTCSNRLTALGVDLCGDAQKEQQIAHLGQNAVGAVQRAKDGDILIGAEQR